MPVPSVPHWSFPFRNALRWIFLSLLVASVQLRADSPNHKQILILHAFHATYSWVEDVNRGILDTLAAADANVDVHVEYLDWKRFPTEENLRLQEALLQAKYRQKPLHLIIAVESPALDFALARRERLFPGVPIVFTGINGYDPAMVAGHSGVTGVGEALDVQGTLNIAFSLHPKVRTVFVLCDGTGIGMMIRRDLERELEHFQRRARFVFLPEQDTESVLAQAVKAPADSLYLIGLFSRDPKGRFLDLWELPHLMQDQGVKVPIYSFYRAGCGQGTVGGSLVSGERQGAVATEMGLRILTGTPPERIPVHTAPTVQRVFDHRMLQRLGIPLSALPPGSEVLHQPQTFYQTHRGLVLGCIAALTALVLALLGLMVRRRAAEQAVRHSEARLRALVEHMPILICAFDAEGQLIEWNSACEQASGCERSKVIRQPRMLTRLVPDETDRGLLRRLATGIDAATDLELPLIHADGEARLILWNSEAGAFPIPGWAGWLVGVDLTERRRAERDRARLSEAFTQAADGILVTDAQGTVLFVNPSGAELLAGHQEGIRGRRLVDLLACTDEPGLPARIGAEALQGSIWKGRFPARRLDGSPFTLEGTLSPIRVGGMVVGMALVFRDITHAMDMEEQARKNQRMESLGALAGGIAHDFGNLLTAIQGAAFLMEEEADDPEAVHSHLRLLENATHKAGELVKQLMGFARARKQESGPLDLHRVLDDVLPILRRTLPPLIQIGCEPGARRPWILGDGGQLSQVLMNLAINARDAMPEGGHLDFVTGNAEGEVWVEVRDTGSGIPEALLERIFEPLFTTKQDGKGTGMGLAMTHAILKHHGGRVEVQSQIGKGTTFRLCFPVMNPEAV